jgi:hypothetical protein
MVIVSTDGMPQPRLTIVLAVLALVSCSRSGFQLRDAASDRFQGDRFQGDRFQGDRFQADDVMSRASLLVSSKPDFSAATSLQGATLGQPFYIFCQLSQPSATARVEMSLDGQLISSHAAAPYDLFAEPSQPPPLWSMLKGLRTVKATVAGDGPTYSVSATFTVPGATSGRLVFSADPFATASWAPLAGAIVRGPTYVRLEPGLTPAGLPLVLFYIDDPTRKSAVSSPGEGKPPFSLFGNNKSSDNPWETHKVANGAHTIDAVITIDGGFLTVVSATFTVDNS